MRIREVIERRVRRKGGGIDLASDLSSVIAVNIGEDSSATSSSAHNVIRQVNGRSRKGSANSRAGKQKDTKRSLNASIAIPVNAAMAANLLSDGSAAGADGTQSDQITQRSN